MTKYIVSPITTYNDETELFETKIGVEGKNMPLHYTAHGKTIKESKERAKTLARIIAGDIPTLKEPKY